MLQVTLLSMEKTFRMKKKSRPKDQKVHLTAICKENQADRSAQIR